MVAEKNKWENSYAHLRSYVAEHPEIGMTAMSLSVPIGFRKSFYAQVDEARNSLTEYILSDKLDDARASAQRCVEMRQRLLAASGLRSLEFAAALDQYLGDPLSALSKPAFGLIIAGLQHNRTPDEVAGQASSPLMASAELLMRNAYEAWAYYGIVLALQPKKFYGVASSDTVEVYPVETDTIVIGSQISSPERRIPEAVFETKDNRVFAMKSEAAPELDYYGIKIQRRRDQSAGGNTAGLLSHRVLLLYQLKAIDDVGVVADRSDLYMTPTDLMCEVLYQNDIETPAIALKFIEHVNSIGSRRAIQVLTMDDSGSFSEGMLEGLDSAIVERRVVGFNESVLKEVAGLLSA